MEYGYQAFENLREKLKKILVRFLDDVLFVNATHALLIVPEHEFMKLHEHMKLFF